MLKKPMPRQFFIFVGIKTLDRGCPDEFQAKHPVPFFWFTEASPAFSRKISITPEITCSSALSMCAVNDWIRTKIKSDKRTHFHGYNHMENDEDPKIKNGWRGRIYLLTDSDTVLLHCLQLSTDTYVHTSHNSISSGFPVCQMILRGNTKSSKTNFIFISPRHNQPFLRPLIQPLEQEFV
jgi:hypothetical protein